MSAAADASQVLLAKKWKDGDDPTGWMMSEKLDGMRAYWSGENFFSRNGNQLNPPAWFVADMPQIPLDGELWCGRGEFQRCMSIVRKSVPTQDWQYVKYLVFDAPKLQSASQVGPAPYEERLAHIATIVNPVKTQHCRAVGSRACQGQQDLESNLRKVEAAGGEGLMVRASLRLACAMHSVQCAVHSAQCTVHSVQCAVCSVQCTRYVCHRPGSIC